MKAPLRPYTIDELLAIQYAPNVVVDEAILDVGGLMLVVGPTSVGKSYLLLQLAMQLATGMAVVGQWAVPRPFRVYLVQAEIGQARFQARVKKLWANFTRVGPVGLWLESTFDLKLDTPDGLAAVEEVVGRLGVEVLVIDPLRPFHNRNENASDEMQRLFDTFLRLQLKWGVAIVFGHHDRKPSADGWGKSIYDTRGNTIITDRPDTVLRLREAKPAGTVEAIWEKMRNRDEKLPKQKWVGDRQTGLFTVGASEPDPRDGKADIVRELLATGGLELGELTAGLVERGGVTSRTAYRIVTELEGAGVVEKVGGGLHNRKVVKLRGG